MDIQLARTFLMIAETGSFIEAGRKMNVTQSTVSARVKSLEELFGRPLVVRSKNGATLTAAGDQFQKHALALVRVWQHAQLEVGLSGPYRDHVAVGAHATLWDGFLLKWISWMRGTMPDLAISGSASISGVITQRLLEGTLDLAVMYRPGQSPGLTMEHLFDEHFVLVTSAPPGSRRQNYVFFDWGEEFQAEHADVFPDQTSAVNLDLGSLGLDYLLANEASGYLPHRLVKGMLKRGRLRTPARSRTFTTPVYLVYPEARDEEAYQPILDGLRRAAAGL